MVRNFALRRQQLVDSLHQIGIYDARVLAAIANIPREEFVDTWLHHQAYANCALPINMGQTISQPWIVAVMTQALQLTGQERVLEIGTGSGYQTAILAYLSAHVYSVERYQELSWQAALHLSQLDIWNVSLFVGDGSLGWLAEAPYDRILVTAAAPDVPSQLFAQLAPDGMLVIPVGTREHQELLVMQRFSDGIQRRSLGSCIFVPLIGAEGWHE